MKKNVQEQLEVFTNTQKWQCYHHYQLCIPLYLQFSSVFAPYNIFIETRCQWMQENCILRLETPLVLLIWHSLKRSWQYWHSCIVESLRKTLAKALHIANY